MTFHRLASCLLLLCSLLLATPLSAGNIFTYPSPESSQDVRALYYRDLLQLALDKTLDTDGGYELRAAPMMNRARLRLELIKGHYTNLFSVDSQRPAAEAIHLDYARFPVDLGILGYRICFVSPARAEEVARITRLDQLQGLLHGQGLGWQDVAILRHNGMQVREVAEYERLFRLVAKGRIDLFCRGANELYSELAQRPEMGLQVDAHLLLYYPFPRLFYTHKRNQQGLDRINRGLQLAWADGSLQSLWRTHFKPALDQAKLPGRLLFKLENPTLTPLDFDYRSYLYDPLNERFGVAP